MPAGVWLGVPTRDTLAFVDLWAGEAERVWSDGTPLGPAFSLAPFECDGRLALFAVERLPISAASDPSPGLRAGEGVYGDPQVRVSRASCQRIEIPL